MSSTPPPTADAHKDAMGTLTGRASVGAAWTVFGYGGRQVIRLASNLILTRLLLAEHFGLMTLVTVFMMFIQLFSDIGIGPAIIQNEREDPDFVNTVWTIQVGRGFAFWAVACAGAGPVAAYYGPPILADLVRVTALVAIIEGFRSTNFFTQNRHLNMKRLIVLEVVAQVFGVIAMIGWASVSQTVWALVAGNIVSASVSTVWSHAWLPGIRNRFRIEKKAVHALFHFGRWIFVSTVLTFLADQADRLVFGKLVTMTVLGVYSIALGLGGVASLAMTHVSHDIIFPLYSRIGQGGKGLVSVYRSARLPLLIVGGWATAGLLAGGPTAIRLMYDERYWGAGWMLQVVAAGMWFGVVLEGSNGAAVLALGHSRWNAVASAVKVIGMAVFIPAGWYAWGFPGALIGSRVADIVRYLASVVGALQFGLDGRKQDATMTLLVVISAAVGWSSLELLWYLGWENVFLHAVAVALVVTLIWSPWFLKLRRRMRGPGGLLASEPPVAMS